MKTFNTIFLFSLFCLILTSTLGAKDHSWIRINQLGYLPSAVKVAVLASKSGIVCTKFEIVNTQSKNTVWASENISTKGSYGPFESTYRLNFSDFEIDGDYYIKVDSIQSPIFKINNNVYKGTADFLLNYMSQQRCGFNPYLNDSCHVHDGFTVYGPMPDGTHIDVTGGWHDAADYLQYVATSANATFNMLMAYRDFPDSFTDNYQANGLPGNNGIEDVLDEAKWGLDWLLKMHPREDWMFNQIADDRDHQGFMLPTQDSIDYGKNLERPVYFCTGEVQGLQKYKNRATGTASTAGKFASAFALGSMVYEDINYEYSQLLKDRAQSAYNFGRNKPGVCQTAPCRAPYFYEEENWTDDMELAAAELYSLLNNNLNWVEAYKYALEEITTPWMGADTARHYQWYPFLNIGHYELAVNAPPVINNQIISFYQEGIEKVYLKAKENDFLMGVPYIWCSNNLVAAFITQCYLYRQFSGDNQYMELEAAMRDWLFGCNPWGTSMIYGLPQDGVSPKDPHSAFTHLYQYPIDGGLIDGPVYGSIFNSLKYVHLKEEDEFAEFQSDLAVYHDDVGDYATNEPTMDGTATLMYYLAAMENEGDIQKNNNFEYNNGAIIRGNSSKKEIALVFTGDQFADGGNNILQTLFKYDIKASFFFTGNFYRNPDFSQLIYNLKSNWHYLGAHSDKHLLYCSWENRDSLLVDKNLFLNDLENNYNEMKKFGISKNDALYFLPPYEWYNNSISNWTKDFGLQLINYTPGTQSHADYTYPELGSQYISSEEIFNSITEHEKSDGLNGFILLLHIGMDPRRTDKFYYFLDRLISELQSDDYLFKRIDELLK